MASGIKGACNRPKAGKNIKRASQKKFRNNSDEAKAKYAQKMASRASRKLKKNRK
jgi:hypothetical protein